MLKIQRFVCNPYQENTYVVSDETQECVIIDCGAYFQDERMALVEYINGNGLTPKHLICTHGHFDHCMGNDTVYEVFGLQPEVNKKDDFLMSNMQDQAMYFLGIEYDNTIPPVGKYIDSNDVIEFGSHKFTVIETPGHTPGGITFYCAEEKVAFTGDTLFQMSIGRTDFEGGDDKEMRHTLIDVLAKLPAETTIWSGHGPKTTIGAEISMNPYLR
ncbi:MAG: MBL fold metallo-hydrolase [Prevotella sp.]|nr:MBL fold metallo-hydrolase [Prevotella sp.]